MERHRPAHGPMERRPRSTQAERRSQGETAAAHVPSKRQNLIKIGQGLSESVKSVNSIYLGSWGVAGSILEQVRFF